MSRRQRGWRPDKACRYGLLNTRNVTQRWSDRDDLGARAGREALIGGMSRAALTLITCTSHAYHMILLMPGCLGASLSCCLAAFSLPLPFCLTTALFIAFSSCLFVLSLPAPALPETPAPTLADGRPKDRRISTCRYLGSRPCRRPPSH